MIGLKVCNVLMNVESFSSYGSSQTWSWKCAVLYLYASKCWPSSLLSTYKEEGYSMIPVCRRLFIPSLASTIYFSTVAYFLLIWMSATSDSNSSSRHRLAIRECCKLHDSSYANIVIFSSYFLVCVFVHVSVLKVSNIQGSKFTFLLELKIITRTRNLLIYCSLCILYSSKKWFFIL